MRRGSAHARGPLLLALLGGWCCADPGATVAPSRWRANSGDGPADLLAGAGEGPLLDRGPDTAVPADALVEGIDRGNNGASVCNRIPPVGCCRDETLWWCAAGVLRSQSCAGRGPCGWSSSEFYDCNTSGAQDPSGTYPLECTFPGLPDAGLSDGAAGCRGVPAQGCCAGNTLRYCVAGAVRQINCARNPTCGWLAVAQHYDCGTEGLTDPGDDARSPFPRECPAPWPDGREDQPVDQGPDLPPPDLGGEGSGPGDGCTCGVTGGRGGAGGAWGILLLLVVGGFIAPAPFRRSRIAAPGRCTRR